jgi:hypothetical protein
MECSVRLFEVDCITGGGSSVYMDMIDTTLVERELTSNFRIDTETIKSSSYYADMDPYRGRISLCTRSRLYLEWRILQVSRDATSS